MISSVEILSPRNVKEKLNIYTYNVYYTDENSKSYLITDRELFEMCEREIERRNKE
jgi:hypothetical protein